MIRRLDTVDMLGTNSGPKATHEKHHGSVVGPLDFSWPLKRYIRCNTQLPDASRLLGAMDGGRESSCSDDEDTDHACSSAQGLALPERNG